MTIRNSWKRVIAASLAMLVVAGAGAANVSFDKLFGNNAIVASAGTFQDFSPETISATLYDDGSVQTVTIKYDFPFELSLYQSDFVVGSNAIYPENGKTYAQTFRGNNGLCHLSNEDKEKCKSIAGSLEVTGLEYVSGGDDFAYNVTKGNIRTYTFPKGYLNPNEDKTVFVYLWTLESQGYYYPDAIIANVQSIDDALYFNDGDDTDISHSRKLNFWTQESTPSENVKAGVSGTPLLDSEPIAKYGEVEYSLNNTDWQSDIPVSTDEMTPGEYTVYYRVNAGTDYNGLLSNTVVTVNKPDPVFAVDVIPSQTYTGEPLELVESADAEGGEIYYALGDENGALEPYTTLLPTATEVGEYYVWYKVVGDENHNDSKEFSAKAVIEEAPEESSESTPDSIPDSSEITPESSEAESTADDSSAADSKSDSKSDTSKAADSSSKAAAAATTSNPATGAAAAGVGALALAAAALIVAKKKKDE